MKIKFVDKIMVFELDPLRESDQKDLLLKTGYIVIYNGITSKEIKEKTLLAPDNLTSKEYNNIIEKIYLENCKE